jgi:acetyl-CoA carboxylase biotin carboxyl carrier protein
MSERVIAELTATVWKVLVEVGQEVEDGQALIILESMKMEIPVECTSSGRVVELLISEGDSVDEGQHLVTIG